MPAFDQVRLSTPRLYLRPLQQDDAAAVYAIHCDPRVVRYWSSKPWTSIDDARALIDACK